MIPIKNFERYCITEDGKVYSTITKRFMKLVENRKDGYHRVSLYNNGIRNRRMVHRLLAEAYVSNPNNLKYVNHLDGIKTNNIASNLEWCTHSDNLKHAYSLDLIPRHGGRKKK